MQQPFETNSMKTSILRTLIISAALFTLSSQALAQYVWLDEKGIKQFSDQPPPASVPKAKILKYSGKNMDSLDSGSDADPVKDAKQPPSAAERELDYRKRRAEIVAKEKKAAEEAQNAQTKSDNCKRLREYKQSLDSGQRITQVDANGNRSYMTDEKRSQDLNTVTQSLGDCGN